MTQKNNEFGVFESIGIVLRLPIFFFIVFLKVFIAAPFEILFKLAFSPIIVLISIGGLIKSIIFSDKELYKESIDDLKEIFPMFTDFESLDFKGTIHFLKYGRYP